MMLTNLTEIVLANKSDDVRQALNSAFNCSKVDEVNLLTGGLSSALVYKVIVNCKAYVLRIGMHRDELHDPVRQFHCMELAEKAGLAPHIYYANPENNIFITAFIAHEKVTTAMPERLLVLTTLVTNIVRLHALPLFPKLVNFIDGVNLFKNAFISLHMFPVAVTEECFSLYDQAAGVYRNLKEDLVSSHNDLNPNNLLFDGIRLWLIDWETAFCNDRYVDLAIAAQFLAQNEAEEKFMLKTYFGEKLSDYHRARFKVMQQVCYMYYAMISLRMAHAKQAFDYIHDASMEVPSLGEFQEQVASGKQVMNSYEGQLIFGKVLLNTTLSRMRETSFHNAIKLIRR